MNVASVLVQADPVRFLQAAALGASVETHADLWRWLQGEVQPLMPHDLLVAAWGDFSTGDLQFDLISSLPGLRTRECHPARVAPLLHYLRDCWVAAQHQPCRVDVHGCAELFGTHGDGWAPGHAMARMRTAVVHGMRDAGGGERILAALATSGPQTESSVTGLALLLPFIDTALRRLHGAPIRPAPAERMEPAPAGRPMELPPGTLSERERQIMVWVAMGKTNPEIGCILRISEFTVKNHMKSIFSKLDVTNRAQAVAKLTRLASYA